jgi:hypothetical protein
MSEFIERSSEDLVEVVLERLRSFTAADFPLEKFAQAVREKKDISSIKA